MRFSQQTVEKGRLWIKRFCGSVVDSGSLLVAL
jgi:hypothetical protein